MLLVSSHVLDCGEIQLPPETVIRVNLAWVNPSNVHEKLSEISHHRIYLDNPVGRTKPPMNRYSFDEIVDLIHQFQNIKYLAVSNVECDDDIKMFYSNVPMSVDIVPKIETIKGIQNIKNLNLAKCGIDKYVMLDHDDLCSDLIRHYIDPALMYTKYINPLIEFCRIEGVNLLRTQGIVFSTVY